MGTVSQMSSASKVLSFPRSPWRSWRTFRALSAPAGWRGQKAPAEALPVPAGSAQSRDLGDAGSHRRCERCFRPHGSPHSASHGSCSPGGRARSQKRSRLRGRAISVGGPGDLGVPRVLQTPTFKRMRWNHIRKEGARAPWGVPMGRGHVFCCRAN